MVQRGELSTPIPRNGSKTGAMGRADSAYSGVAVDRGKDLSDGDGGRTVVLVRPDPRSREGCWAEGGGIYRRVRLVVTGLVRVARHGVFVRTERLEAHSAAIR